MALKMLKLGERKRLLGCMVWIEDLEREGKSYGDLLAFADSLHVKCVVSPIHDKDTYTAEDVKGWCKRHIDPDTGDVAEGDLPRQPQVGAHKKSHVHWYFKLPGSRSGKEMSALVEDFYHVPPTKWAIVNDWETMVRYCAHMDSPNKAWYSPLDVHGFGGVDLSCLMATDKTESIHTTLEISEYMEQSNCRYFHKLWRWAKESADQAIIANVKGNASFYCLLMQSERQERMDIAEDKRERGSQNT